MTSTEAKKIMRKTGNPHDLKIGQKLWLVPKERYHGVPREVTVGKFWRFNLTTLVVTDKRGEYSQLGRCYLGRAKYEAECELWVLWTTFVRRLDAWNHPPGMTIEEIASTAARWGINMENAP